MPPGAAQTFYVHIGNMKPGVVAEVSGVIYADGTEAGRESTLRLIHSLREEVEGETNSAG
jgi:hypothetical protein